MTSASIRSFLIRNPYKRPGRVLWEVENLLVETATQVDVFYELCNGASRPPTQEEYVKKYLELCSSEISQKGVDPKEFGKRIARAWATYVSELDFHCQLRDSGLFEQVIIDTKLNAEKGYDVMIAHKGKIHYVHLSFVTMSEREWVKIKARRKAGVPEAIDFPLFKENADFMGNIHLYKALHVRRLKQKLNEISSED